MLAADVAVGCDVAQHRHAQRARYYVKGSDWRERGLPPEQAVICREHGIEIVYLDTLLDSSTRLLQQFTDQDQHRQQGQQ